MPRSPERDAGLKLRHARKEARLTITCRYLDVVPGGLCSFEAVDPEGEIRLCRKHLARAVELLSRRGFEIQAPSEQVV